MNKVHSKTKYKLLWVIVVIILIVVYGASFWYVKTKIEKASYENSSAQIAYEQKDTIQNVVNSLSDIEPHTQKIDSFFVGADNVVDFINTLEQNASDQNTQIETTNVTILTQEEMEDREEISYGEVLQVSLTVSGDWNDVMQYVRLVEGLPYNIWIESAIISLEEREIESEAEEETQGTEIVWKANLILNVLKHPSV